MNKTEKPDYSSFEKYQFGELAARLFTSEKSKRYANSALELLAGKGGLNLGEEADGFIRGTQASEEGIKTAISVYAGKFQEKRGEYTPAQLAGWYDNILSDLDDREKQKITDFLGKYKEMLKTINEKVQKASHILEGKNIKGLYTQEQILNAEKQLEKYQSLILTLQVLDNYKFESLRPEAVNTARVKDLKELASKL